MSGVRGSLRERLYRRVVKSDGCWEWTGHLHRGYGQIGAGRNRVIYTHRASWELEHGPVPPGLFVCHHCDNPKCVRPDHLWLGTARDNAADRDQKGRTNNGQASKTHCKHGHEFTAENTYLYLDGRGRQCKACWTSRRKRHEVSTFLVEDAVRLRAFIGLTDDPPGLRLMESA